MKSLRNAIVIVLFAALFAILPSSVQVEAASDKPVLEVTVTDAKSGVAMISGIDIPETLEYKYDGVEGGHCAYSFEILFGNYGVSDEENGSFTGPYIDMREAEAGNYVTGDTFTIKETGSKKITMTITRDGNSKTYVLTK